MSEQPLHARYYCPTDGCHVCMPPIDPCSELRAEVERLRVRLEARQDALTRTRFERDDYREALKVLLRLHPHSGMCVAEEWDGSTRCYCRPEVQAARAALDGDR